MQSQSSFVRKFSPELAKELGLNQAIVIGQVDYWVKKNQNANINFHDGRYWTYNSFERWQSQFPFWSVGTIKRIFSDLRQRGILLVGNYNKLKFDKTNWYTLDYSKLSELVKPSGEDTAPEPSEQMVKYEDYIVSKEWEAKRKERIKRDHYQCAMCGTAKNLQVHHITYERLGHEELDDLITLCKDCHAKVHENDLAKKGEHT